MSFDRITSVVYYGLNTDLSHKNYYSKESAILAQPYLIVKETKGIWYNYEYTNQAIELEVFNSAGFIIDRINEGKWMLLGMNIQTNYYVQSVDFYATIMDTQGNSYSKVFGNGFSGLLNGIKTMREMARFECLEHYNLFKENEKLKQQIEQVSAEIQVLQGKIT